jgi:hypothetical protein
MLKIFVKYEWTNPIRLTQRLSEDSWRRGSDVLTEELSSDPCETSDTNDLPTDDEPKKEQEVSDYK